MEYYKAHFGSQMICNIIDENSGLLGYIVIDSPVYGHSCGGLKVLPDVSIPELQGLARVMTLKFSFLGMRESGAKAGIVADPSMPRKEKLALLRKFAEIASPLLKTSAYVPASDMGTSNEEIRYMLESIGLKVPQSKVQRKEEGGFYVGFSVFAGARAAAKHMNLDLSQSTLAVEGFGKVGSSVAKVFWQRGTKVVAISTFKGAIYQPEGLDVDRLVHIRNEVGDDVVNVYEKAKKIKKSELLTLDVDILSPCARHHSINLNNAEKIRAKIICAGANIPVTREAENILYSKGKLCLPDFVTNCGGILASNMENAGLSGQFIENFIIQEIGNKILEIIEAARKKNMSPVELAEMKVEEKIAKIRTKSKKKTIKNRLFNIALKVYKKNLIPKLFAKLYAPRYFRARLG
ncbi:MAG: Glu/Leu/Phe/Val dehydrogenase [bacterium]